MFLIFTGPEYDTDGGWNDLYTIVPTLQEVKVNLLKLYHSYIVYWHWFQVIKLESDGNWTSVFQESRYTENLKELIENLGQS